MRRRAFLRLLVVLPFGEALARLVGENKVAREYEFVELKKSIYPPDDACWPDGVAVEPLSPGMVVEIFDGAKARRAVFGGYGGMVDFDTSERLVSRGDGTVAVSKEAVG